MACFGETFFANKGFGCWSWTGEGERGRFREARPAAILGGIFVKRGWKHRKHQWFQQLEKYEPKTPDQDNRRKEEEEEEEEEPEKEEPEKEEEEDKRGGEKKISW